MLALPSHVQDGIANDQEPRWVRLTRTAADTTGVAQVGLYGNTIITGHWRRVSADSIRVDAGDAFDAVWLRLDESRDTTYGTVELRTDADILERDVPLRPWTGARGACPEH